MIGIDSIENYVFPSFVFDNDVDLSSAINAICENPLSVIAVSAKGKACFDAIIRILEIYPDMIIIGTDVVTQEQFGKMVNSGVRIVMTPGFSEEMKQWCLDDNATLIPGCSTATELMRCAEAGFAIIHIYPAGSIGGSSIIEEFSSAFGDIKFIPSGGIRVGDVMRYSTCENVYAICCDDLTDNKSIKDGLEALRDYNHR